MYYVLLKGWFAGRFLLENSLREIFSEFDNEYVSKLEENLSLEIKESYTSFRYFSAL